MNPAEPLLGAALADHLIDNRATRGDKPTADHTLLRGSDAGACARKIAFGALKIPRVVPYTPDTLMAFDAGEHHHTRLQGILAQKFGAELEVPISYKEQGIDISGHADAVYTSQQPLEKRVTEIKSMKGYPFILAAGGVDRYGRNVEAAGPKLEHLLQAGIYAHAPQIEADAIHMVYINKEDGRVAEWLIDMNDEVVGPEQQTLTELVVAELDRLQAIGDDIRRGLLPWRSVPGHGVVKDPNATKDQGAFWGCAYCSWQPLCARLPISKVGVRTATFLEAACYPDAKAPGDVEAVAALIRTNGTPPPDQWDDF